MAKRSGEAPSLQSIVQNAPTNSEADRQVTRLMADYCLDNLSPAHLPYVFRYLGTRVGNDLEKGETVLQNVADAVIRRQPRLRGLVLQNLRIGKARYRVALNEGTNAELEAEVTRGREGIEAILDNEDIPVGEPDSGSEE